jgi:hypothetical protein
MSEKDREKIAYAFLKQIRNRKRMRKSKRVKFWRNYELLHGDAENEEYKSVNEFLEGMCKDGIFKDEDGNREYVVSEKGERMYKRGWVYMERKWYDEDVVRKYTVIISLTALVVAIAGNNNIWYAIKFLWQQLWRVL